MTNTAPRELVTCSAKDCTAEFFYVEARGDTAHLCLDHGHEHLRAHGFQNDPRYSVD